MRVLVDMDGVLADFDQHLYNITHPLRLWPNDYSPATQTHRFSTDCIPNRVDRNYVRSFTERKNFFYNLPPVKGAIEGFQKLVELAEVWILTKPLESNPFCRDEKAGWVRDHLGVEWEKRLIIAPDKSMVRADLLLDDAPKPHWIPQAIWLPVIYSQPFNGVGSKWEQWPHWDWSRSTEELLNAWSHDLFW